MKRSIHKLSFLLLAGLMIVAATSCERKPVKLQWNLAEGTTYVYRSEVTGTWRIEGWEQGERSGEFGNLLVTSKKVLEVLDDGEVRIQESDELKRENASFEPTVIKYTLAPNGKVYDLVIADPGNAPRFIDSQSAREQMFDQSQPTYPDRVLKPGETWVQETKVVFDDRVLTATNTFEVSGWEKLDDYMCLRIDYKANTVIPFERNKNKLIETGESSGSIWFAPDPGLVVQQVDSTTMSTTRVTPKEGGQKVPATYVVESVRVFQLIEIK